MRCRRIGFCPSSAPIRYALVNAVTQEYQYYTYNDKGLIATYYNNHNSDNYRYTYDVAGRLLSGGSLIGYGAGAIGSAFALAGGGVISSGAAVGVAAVATGVGVIVAGGVIANQLGVLMAKGDGRRIGHNQYENKQFNDAVRSAGYDIKDPKIKDDLKAVHKYLRSRKTTPRYQELIQIIKEFLN